MVESSNLNQRERKSSQSGQFIVLFSEKCMPLLTSGLTQDIILASVSRATRERCLGREVAIS